MKVTSTDPIHIGFSGTRDGMTDCQISAIREELTQIANKKKIIAHHGDCVGADQQFHAICESIRDLFNNPTWIKIVIHPPFAKTLRAYCRGDEIRSPKSYRERNEDIARSSQKFLAAPKSDVDDFRSGTWQTVRMAEEQPVVKSITIYQRDGEVIVRK